MPAKSRTVVVSIAMSDVRFQDDRVSVAVFLFKTYFLLSPATYMVSDAPSGDIFSTGIPPLPAADSTLLAG